MRMSKYKLIVWIALATLIFLLFQIIFVNYLKTFYTNSNSVKEDAVRYINPRFRGFHSLDTTSASAHHLHGNPIDIPDLDLFNQFNSSDFRNGNANNYVVRFKVPLDTMNGKPFVFYQLPFNHKKNSNISSEFVQETSQTKQEPTNNLVELPNNKLPRGIDKKKYGLYLPDADGKFKCLNSNVTILD